jgi:demethylmenaquinone methyltransferase/2-methoxy-6-polyprenyl-1,4-benzoquinol methylase
MPDGLPKIFAEVAPTYERVNRVLTLGFDRFWRRRAVRRAVEGGGTLWLDVCSGTGETAAALAARASPETTILAVDFCPPMLAGLAEKNARRISGPAIRAIVADVKRLPVRDASADLITISFATRNLNLSRAVLTATLAEFRRVLRPGGRLVNVETSQPKPRLLRTLFHAYVKAVVLKVGFRISGSRAGYSYLASTIPKFYDPETLAAILRAAGFSEVRYRRLLWGVAAIHRAVR